MLKFGQNKPQKRELCFWHGHCNANSRKPMLVREKEKQRTGDRTSVINRQAACLEAEENHLRLMTVPLSRQAGDCRNTAGRFQSALQYSGILRGSAGKGA